MNPIEHPNDANGDKTSPPTSPSMPQYDAVVYVQHNGTVILNGRIPLDERTEDKIHRLRSAMQSLVDYASRYVNVRLSVERRPEAPPDTRDNQIKLLGQALGSMLKCVGVIKTGDYTGPELLSAAENYIESSEHVATDSSPKKKATTKKPVKKEVAKKSTKKSTKRK